MYCYISALFFSHCCSCGTSGNGSVNNVEFSVLKPLSPAKLAIHPSQFLLPLICDRLYICHHDRGNGNEGRPTKTVLVNVYRVCFVQTGNFFQPGLPPAEIYLLCFILHDWPDDKCHTILSNVAAALKKGLWNFIASTHSRTFTMAAKQTRGPRALASCLIPCHIGSS